MPPRWPGARRTPQASRRRARVASPETRGLRPEMGAAPGMGLPGVPSRVCRTVGQPRAGRFFAACDGAGAASSSKNMRGEPWRPICATSSESPRARRLHASGDIAARAWARRTCVASGAKRTSLRPLAVRRTSARRASSGDADRSTSLRSTRRLTTTDTELWSVCVRSASFVHREYLVSAKALEHEELRSADPEPLLCLPGGDTKLADEEAKVVQDRARLIGRPRRSRSSARCIGSHAHYLRLRPSECKSRSTRAPGRPAWSASLSRRDFAPAAPSPGLPGGLASASSSARLRRLRLLFAGQRASTTRSRGPASRRVSRWPDERREIRFVRSTLRN